MKAPLLKVNFRRCRWWKWRLLKIQDVHPGKLHLEAGRSFQMYGIIRRNLKRKFRRTNYWLCLDFTSSFYYTELNLFVSVDLYYYSMIWFTNSFTLESSSGSSPSRLNDDRRIENIYNGFKMSGGRLRILHHQSHPEIYIFTVRTLDEEYAIE
jgi:hypothetical protein